MKGERLASEQGVSNEAIPVAQVAEAAVPYFVARNGEVTGPLTWDALRATASAGVLDAADHVFSPTLGRWTPAREVVALFEPGALSYSTGGLGVMGERRYAGFWIRFGAYMIDLIIGGIFTFMVDVLLVVLFERPLNRLPEQYGIPLSLLLRLVIYWLYNTAQECSKRGSTIGKAMVGLRVINYQGKNVTLLQSTWRYWAKLLSAMPLMFGFFCAGFLERKTAFHDLLARTYVIYK